MAAKSDTPSTEDTNALPVEAAPVIEAPAAELPIVEAPVEVPAAAVEVPVVEAAPALDADAPVLTLSLGGPGEVTGVITNVSPSATYSLHRTSSPGDVTLSSPLYQSTTFTAASLPVGITYTFTTTALMSDGTSATSAPVTISL